MSVDDFGLYISQFEETLEKITANMSSGIIFERFPPLELWNRYEADVTALRDLAGRLREIMLFLRPETVPTTERRFRELIANLSTFRDILHQKSEAPLANSKLAFEQLRKVLIEGSDFVELARDVQKTPSESISEVLRLKETYSAKEYLSNVSVPEAVYARFVDLRKDLENLKARVSELEHSIEEVNKGIGNVEEQMSRFRPASIEMPADKKGSEPSLVSQESK